ncbi:ankyrin repeat domain-containing protein [Paludisphaera soli]|uniref:ankyrin repeat domain-containing protein n=1 Tax=Paludisphaera soli TaxID=2712865 RepID=UPI0013EA7FFA|nr:ankyrin repeat domain-containing protein [Paludisphaera soli]
MDDTPLHKAETIEEVETALDAGWAVEHPGWMGGTPLHRAAERGLPEIVLALIRRGANVDARRPEREDSPLHFAANAGVARALIDHGADIEARDWSDRTPLHWAAQSGHADVAGLLIESGARVDGPSRDGSTPLHWAAQQGHVEAARLLLRAGAWANRKDGQGRTPLHSAAWRGWAEVVELLLGAGADPAERNKGGQTPRHEARSNGHEATAKLLEVAQGESAGEDRSTTEPPAARSLGLTRVRTHPLRFEAVTVADEATLHRWSLGESPHVVAGLRSHHAWFADIAVAPQGDVFAVTTPESTIEMRRWDDLRVVFELPCPMEGRGGLQALDLAPDGCWLAVADPCEQVHLIDRATGKVVATVNGGEQTLCVRFHPSSLLVAAACSFQGGGHVRIDRIESGRLIPVAELERSDFRTPAGRFVDTLAHLAFSPDGRHLALFETSRHGTRRNSPRPAGWRGDVALYDVGTWTLRWTASVDAKATGDDRTLAEAGHGMGFLTEVQFVDDETLACGATEGLVLFYRVGDGRLARKVRVHPVAPVVSLAMEPSRQALWAALGEGGGRLIRIPR